MAYRDLLPPQLAGSQPQQTPPEEAKSPSRCEGSAMETVTLCHRSPREIRRCERDPTNPTPAAAREKAITRGQGCGAAALAQPLRRVTPSLPAAGVGGIRSGGGD